MNAADFLHEELDDDIRIDDDLRNSHGSPRFGTLSPGAPCQNGTVCPDPVTIVHSITQRANFIQQLCSFRPPYPPPGPRVEPVKRLRVDRTFLLSSSLVQTVH